MNKTAQSSSTGFGEWLKNGLDWILLGISLLAAVIGILNFTPNTVLWRAITISAFIIYFLTSLWIAFRSEARQIWKWVSLVTLYIFTAIFCFWIGGWQKSTIPTIPGNLTYHFGFENGMPVNVSLGICDNTPQWYDVCVEAPTHFKLASSGLSGGKSLEVDVETNPTKEQVYSLRLPIDPPVFADAVDAMVNVAHADKFSKITLAVRMKGENIWIFSDMKPVKDGWMRILVDLQNYKANNPSRDIAVDELHFDMFLNKGQQAIQKESVLIDDIELYFPISPSLKTGP